MPVTRVTIKLNKNSGEPADSAMNVWHFWHPYALNVPLAQKIGFAVTDFYRTLNFYISLSVNRSGLLGMTCTLAALTPNTAGVEDDVVSPAVYTFNDAMTGPSPPISDPLPNEVAICLSFSSDLTDVPESSAGGTMRPASRRRGRVYLGPWQNAVLAFVPINSEPRVHADVQNLILTKYTLMIAALQATTTPSDVPQRVSHVVYSPTTSIEWPVTKVWVDSEFDTIRSRGIRSFGKVEAAVTQSQALVA